MANGRRELTEWKSKFLEDRSLKRPTGENLYSYKLKKSEFELLEIKFQNWIQEETQFRSVSHLVKSSLFNQLFVLYASEWWRRKFSGGHWSWDPILNDLNIDPNDWSAPKRSECVERGFKEWKLGLKNKTGKRFLGSVAIQGGLPMNLMADNHGSVSRVLHRVVDLMPGTRIEPDLILSWVKSLSHYLPNTYQKDEIYELLTEVIMVITSIKQEIDSTDPNKILNEWRSNSDKWQHRFPISVSDDKTYRIIENLVKKVAESKERRSKKFVLLERELDFHGEDNGRLSIKIQFDEYVSSQSLKKNFSLDDEDELASHLFIELVSDDETVELSLRRIIGSDKYKFSETVISGFSGIQAKSGIHVTLRDKKGNRWYNTDLRLDPLEDNMPWIFSWEQDATSLIYLGQGSCKISGNKFVVVLPNEMSVKSEEPFELLGKIFGNYLIKKFSSDSIFFNNDGEEFRVRTKFTGDTKSVLMRGESLESIFEMPSNAFRGVPTLFGKRESGLEKVITDYKWKVGSKKYISTSNSFCGPSFAFKMDGNYFKWKKKVCVVPGESSEQMIRGLDAKSGIWRLRNWKIETMVPLTPDVICIKKDGDQWLFEYEGSGSTPENIQANIGWRDNPLPARIRLPFPTQGVRVFDKNSKEVEDGTLFSIAKTKGVRVNLIPGDNINVKLELRTNSSSVPLEYVDFSEGETAKQLRLMDYKDEFERLLSLSQDLDEVVEFSIFFDDKKQFHLKIARYSFQLKKEDDRWYLPNNILRKINDDVDKNYLRLKTQRLDTPGVADIEVTYRESGHIVIPEEAQSPGPWIIYSSNDSDLLMRPTQLAIRGEDTQPLEVNDLETAMRIDDKIERLAAVDSVLNEMTNNPDHKNWETVARLVNEYGHLPLSFLDVWKRAIHNHDFMALLASGYLSLPDEFIDRFALELPFMFEFIPLKSFEKAIEWQSQALKENLLNVELPEDHLYEFIDRKRKGSEWMFESFKYPYLVALNRVIGLHNQELRLCQINMINYKDQLFEANDSHYQRLRQSRDHNGSRWPSDNDLFNLISKHVDPNDPLFNLDEGYRSVVINLPILLGKWVSESNDNLEKFNSDYVQMIRKVKDFDQSWFTNAFNLSLLKFYYDA